MIWVPIQPTSKRVDPYVFPSTQEENYRNKTVDSVSGMLYLAVTKNSLFGFSLEPNKDNIYTPKLSTKTSKPKHTLNSTPSSLLKTAMSQISYFTFLFFFFFTLLPSFPSLPALTEPDPASIQPFSTTPSSAATIPAFPEQSDVAGCPLDLPDDLFHAIKSSCGSTRSGQLHRTRCCPVLAAWLFSAYSKTALGRAGRAPQTASYDLPLLPDDSETCVTSLENALNNKGIELVKPNNTCDVVYCYCGIRLHPLSCPEAFSVSQNGELVGDQSVKRLERDCFSNSLNGYSGLAGCSKCLNSLYRLNEDKTGNTSKLEDRTSKMRNRDCELMGLTWLLAKNRSTYIHTVSAVLRAIMMSTDGSDPLSCSLNSDGMPLAVDSSEINDQSSSTTLHLPIALSILSLVLFYMSLFVSSTRY